MKTHLRLFVVTGLTKLRLHLLLMVAVAAIAFPSLISAAPVEASGTWDDCNFAPVFRGAGANTVETVGITENFFGTLLGTYAGTERDVIYADGSATFHAAAYSRAPSRAGPGPPLTVTKGLPRPVSPSTRRGSSWARPDRSPRSTAMGRLAETSTASPAPATEVFSRAPTRAR